MSLGCGINGCTINTAPIDGCCFGAQLVVTGYIDAYAPAPVFFDTLVATCVEVPAENRSIMVPFENRTIVVGSDGKSCGLTGA